MNYFFYVYVHIKDHEHEPVFSYIGNFQPICIKKILYKFSYLSGFKSLNSMFF